MTNPNFTGTQIFVPNATALAGAPSVSNDAIDAAIATLGADVFAYVRAKDWTNPAASGLVDLTGNLVTTQHTGQTYNSSDASFGGLPSISVAGCSDTPYVITSRGVAPPASWTFLAALDITSIQASGKVSCLISQTQGGTGSLGLTCYENQTVVGTGAFQGPSSGQYALSSGLPAAINTPCIFVCSFDDSTGMGRVGLNGLPGIAKTFTNGSPAPGSADVFRIFGNVTDNGDNTFCKFETFAILNVAAGAGYAVDPPLTAAIASMRGVYGF